jgi:hypothetical protein
MNLQICWEFPELAVQLTASQEGLSFVSK